MERNGRLTKIRVKLREASGTNAKRKKLSEAEKSNRQYYSSEYHSVGGVTQTVERETRHTNQSSSESDTSLSESEEEEAASKRVHDLRDRCLPHRKNQNAGWTTEEVCVILLHIARKHGIPNNALNKMLSVIALVLETERNPADICMQFPRTASSAEEVAKLDELGSSKVVYMCPKKLVARQKGKTGLEQDICGYTLKLDGKGGFLL